MGTTVEVIFDKENKTYSPGDTIKGTVLVLSNDDKNLRLIKGTRVRCKGLSSVDLKFGLVAEESGASLAHVSFIDEDAKVLPHQLKKTDVKQGSAELTQWEYPFRFTLAKDLPSSFKTSYGKIEYFFKVYVPSGVAVSYFEGKGQFHVVSVLDLNKRPELKEPLELKEDATVKTLLTEGNVSFVIRLPRKGYAIGETISLHQEVTNNCKQSVNANISLIQRITYEFGGAGMLRLDKDNKMKVFGKTIKPHETDVCDEEIFEIPIVPVTAVVMLKEDKKVKVEYFLKYEIVTKPLWLKKVKGYVPLVIGSVPFKDDDAQIELKAMKNDP